MEKEEPLGRAPLKDVILEGLKIIAKENKMPIKPVRDNLYIIPIEDPLESKSGLVIHEKARQRCDNGIVKYKGPAVSSDIAVGDRVIFSGYSGTRMAVADEGTLIILEEEFIDAIWVKGKPSRVFTEEQLKDWIAKAVDAMYVKGGVTFHQGAMLNEISVHLNHYVDASFESDSLLF